MGAMWKGFQKPKRLAAELESLTDKFGKFSAQPFERGWGTTVGNALRRTLLSSIEGAAITAVRIEGVMHEFSSIPGVVDATDIILNLKQVPKLNTDQTRAITLNAQVPGVTNMIEAPLISRCSIAYIATVSGGKLELEMRGRIAAAMSALIATLTNLPIGYIPVDSVHSPVRKVNYSVEAARLGQMTDYDRLMRGLDQRRHHAPGRHRSGSQADQSHMSIFINFEEQPELAEEAVNPTTIRARSAGSLGRGTRAFRSLLQFTRKREHPDHSRTRRRPKRNAQDQELRPRRSMKSRKSCSAWA
jgi:DNA-directed RNA polymerase subunit alpha